MKYLLLILLVLTSCGKRESAINAGFPIAQKKVWCNTVPILKNSHFDNTILAYYVFDESLTTGLNLTLHSGEEFTASERIGCMWNYIESEYTVHSTAPLTYTSVVNNTIQSSITTNADFVVLPLNGVYTDEIGLIVRNNNAFNVTVTLYDFELSRVR